jgi:glycosyltransferase involved in cell wall biosynthesis
MMQKRISEFDLVHTHLPFIFPTRLASRIAKQADIPLFYHQRGVLDPARLKFRSLKKRLYLELVEKNILSNANTLFALTSAEVDSYRQLGTAAPHVIIPNGIDAGQFHHAVDDSRFAMWGVSPSDLIILFLGRIHPLKGPERIFDAFLRIAQRIPNAKLVLAGPDEFSLCAKLRARADASGFGARVIIPGMVSGQTKLDLLARADLFVLPSDAEGFSIAILEAMASHTPVMISPGCHFDAVEHARAGRVVANNPEEMANTLAALLSDREGLSVLGHNARQLVERQYSWSNVVKGTVDAYRAGLDRHRPLPGSSVR